jgi:hypothetical protein
LKKNSVNPNPQRKTKDRAKRKIPKRNQFNHGKEEGRGDWKKPCQQKANIIPPYHFSSPGRR